MRGMYLTNSTSTYDKNFQPTMNRGCFLNLVNGIYIFLKTTANITLNGERLKGFPLRSVTR